MLQYCHAPGSYRHTGEAGRSFTPLTLRAHASCSHIWSKTAAAANQKSVALLSPRRWRSAAREGVMKVVSTQKLLNVLFLCTGNSARSQMAEVILNRLGAGKFRAFSAGSQPTGHVHPMAVQMLRNAHYDTSKLRSKSWEEFAGHDALQLDFVFTVCDCAAKEVCPIWPGQ